MVALLCLATIQAQTITGTVSDATGPLPGANVLVKGTTNGTQTDFDGNYTIDADTEATLVFSYIGYKTAQVPVSGQTSIDITLEEDASKLDEVVVTGYGSQSKRNLTGSVAVVDVDQLLAVPATTFAQQLQGRAAGVNIVNDSRAGGAATVRIRGYGSVGNNDPLYIIDGVPSTDQGNLNPNDIESLQVLKDASASSIYGSRAANGVIIITTKKGKMGKPVISYNTFYGVQNAPDSPDVLDAQGLGEYLYLADVYAGRTPTHGQYGYGSNGEITIPDFVFPSGTFEGDPATNADLYSLTPDNIYAITRSADTNWFEEITRSAPIQQHNISASGATENARYAFSLGYFNQEDIVKFVGYNRVSLRANTEFKGINNKLTIGENFTASFENRKGVNNTDEEQGPIAGSYKHHPLLPVRDIAGNFAGSRGANLGNNFSPYAAVSRNQDDRRYDLRLLGNVYAAYQLADNLEIRTSFGVDATVQRVRNIGRPQPEYVEGNFINSSQARSQYAYAWTWTNGLTWNKTFDEVHNVTAYAGVEAIQQFAEGFEAARNVFAFDTNNIISYLDLGDATTASNRGYVLNDFSLWSQFARLNYDYDGKYLAEVTLRNDSSSRFKAASRSAVFPAFSLGWRISDESFMDGVDWIDEMKVRYGWGQTGNQEIGNYNAFTTYRSDIVTGGYPIDGSTSSPAIGFQPGQFGNPNAKWETTTSNNVGLDMVMLKNKLTFSLDVWDRVVTDMLLPAQPTFTAGQATPPSVNVGGATSKGFDIALGYNGQIGDDFTFGINGNLSAYKNEIDALSSPGERIFGRNERISAITVTEAGSPISSYFGYQVLGIFQSEAEADAAPQFGDYNAAGKFQFADTNGDGAITSDDRTIIGNPHPDFVYGINLDFSYKDLSLNIFGNGSQGNDVFNYVRYFADFNTFQGNRSTRALNDAWQPANPTAPRAQWTAANPNATSPIMDADDATSSQPSSYLIEDGSFFRIRNIQLTYNFPENVLSDIGLATAQIYLQAQNVATFTKYSGLNPEVGLRRTGDSNRNLTLGYDGGFNPVAATISLGLNITLQ
jgi:TonB-linked SusC/RagA family outer membrane protein